MAEQPKMKIDVQEVQPEIEHWRIIDGADQGPRLGSILLAATWIAFLAVILNFAFGAIEPGRAGVAAAILLAAAFILAAVRMARPAAGRPAASGKGRQA